MLRYPFLRLSFPLLARVTPRGRAAFTPRQDTVQACLRCASPVVRQRGLISVGLSRVGAHNRGKKFSDGRIVLASIEHINNTEHDDVVVELALQ